MKVLEVEVFVDYLKAWFLQGESGRALPRLVSHKKFRQWLSDKTILDDYCLNGEHVQVETKIDYYTLIMDEENLKKSMTDYLTETLKNEQIQNISASKRRTQAVS